MESSTTVPIAIARERAALIQSRGTRQSRTPFLVDWMVVHRPMTAESTAPLKTYLRIRILSLSP